MKIALISAFCTAIIATIAILYCLEDSPGVFWVYPLNNTECSLEAIKLKTNTYSINFDKAAIDRIEESLGQPQLYITTPSKEEYTVNARFTDCASIESKPEIIEKRSGYYIQIYEDKINFDRRM